MRDAKYISVRGKWGSGCIIKVWFPEWSLFRGKNVSEKAYGTGISVRCPKFRGGRFSEVGNVLLVWDFRDLKLCPI